MDSFLKLDSSFKCDILTKIIHNPIILKNFIFIYFRVFIAFLKKNYLEYFSQSCTGFVTEFHRGLIIEIFKKPCSINFLNYII